MSLQAPSSPEPKNLNLSLPSWPAELSPRVAAYARRHFIEFGAGYGLRLIDLWMLVSASGTFTINAYTANGTATAVTATSRDQKVSLQWMDGTRLPLRPLPELRRLVDRAIESCINQDGIRLESLHFSDDTPKELQEAIQEVLPSALDNDMRCAALMDDGLPMITTQVVEDRQMWVLLFNVDHAIHVRVADSLPGLTESVQLLQLVGLWPVGHVTLSRLP